MLYSKLIKRKLLNNLFLIVSDEVSNLIVHVLYERIGIARTAELTSYLSFVS